MSGSGTGLACGEQYALCGAPPQRDADIIFVKLTDAALKAIEDFIRSNRGKVGASPTIQFLPGNEGKISIPAGVNGQHSPAAFHFSLHSNADIEGPQGSFECVRSGGARRLESCGPLPRKMRVQANDDSYEATKHRMAKTVAEEQSKFTRVIKPNQTDIGRRVKVRASHQQPAAPPAHAHAPAPLHHPAAPPAPAPHHHPPPPPPLHHPAPAAAAPAHPARQLPQPPPHSHTQPNHTQRAHGNNPEIARRPVKERLIQLLALKPYKKPELYLRLSSEGIKDKERAVINTILQQISSLKDNCYRLHRHIWNDVNEDWPYYTEDEKRTLKRRKPQNLTPPLSSDSTNSLSPRASPGGGGGGGGGGAGKRASDPAELPSKKQRISHYRRPEAARPAGGSPSSGYATAGSGASSGERHASDNEDERNGKKDHGYTLSFNTAKEFASSSPMKQNGIRNSPQVEPISAQVNSISVTNPEPLENENVDITLPDETNPSNQDIEREWPAITCASERRRYKKEFAAQFAEYGVAYGRVAQVAKYFTQLERRLKRAQPHSPDHQDITRQIVEAYQRMRRDDNYQKEKRLVAHLHRKLTHIKRMVQNYDQQSVREMKGERGAATAGATQAY